MDAILFLAIWLGGASIHTLIELKIKTKRGSETVSEDVYTGDEQKQPVTIKKGANSYE